MSAGSAAAGTGAGVSDLPASAPDWFARPSSDFWPSVYWFWHRQPTEAELRRQVNEIAAAGFGTMLIQPRLAFPRERYLDAEYLTAYRTAVMFARDAGLKVGIYDDYNWMTGHGGGLTVAGRPEIRERHLFWSEAAPAAGSATCTFSEVGSSFLEGLGNAGRNWYYENGSPLWADWAVVAVLAHPSEVSSPDDIIDITASARIARKDGKGCAIIADLATTLLPEGYRVTAFVSARCASSRLINYLMPEAAERFVEVGYEPYRRAVGDFFGDPILYMFFDHPHAAFYGWSELKGAFGNSLMYADVLKTTFERRYARPLAPTLLALIRSVGPATARWRGDFFATYTGLAHDNFLGRLSAWAKEHGIGLAGHEILTHVGGWGLNDGFSRIDPRATIGVDYFDVDRYRTHTTVDASNFNAQLSTKMGDSVARAHGRSRCIVEQYAVSVRPTGGVGAAGQWELTLETLRAQAIRLHLLGARQFLFHGYYQTDGWDGDPEPFSNPRFDFAPGINFEPWFPHVPAFSAESARLSAFMECEPASDVAVLYPLQTARVAGPRHVHGAHAGAWCRGLFEAGLGYFLVDELDLARATVGHGRLRICGLDYRALVLPAVTNLLTAKTLAVIEAFIAGGGIVVASGPPVASVHDDPTEAGVARAARILSGERRAESVPDAGTIQRLAAQLERDLPLVLVEPATSLLRQWRGHDGDGRRLVLFNDGADPVRVSIGLGSMPARLERWRPESGAVEPWAWIAGDDGDTAVVSLEPNELFCLRVLDAKVTAPRIVATSGAVDRFARSDEGRLTASLTFRAGEPLDIQLSAERPPRVQVAGGQVVVEPQESGWRVATRTAAREPIVVADDWTFSAGGAGHATAIKVDSGWQMQGFDRFSGLGHYEVEFNVAQSVALGAWQLVLDAVHTTASVTFNGVALGARIARPYRFAVPPGLVRSGANHLRIEVCNTGANRYYADTPYLGPKPDESGLAAAPRFEPVVPVTIEF